MLRRECVEELLTHGGDSLAYNSDSLLPCDLSDSRSPVWAVLEHDMQWRTTLQVCALSLNHLSTLVPPPPLPV